MIGHGAKIWGVTCIGERGQIVIPVKLREEMGIKKSEEFVVMSHDKGNAIILVPTETMTGMLKGVLGKIEGFQMIDKKK